ncbi:MAG: hypothetical protein AAF799_28740 [Myxococcota bacterium]
MPTTNPSPEDLDPQTLERALEGDPPSVQATLIAIEEAITDAWKHPSTNSDSAPPAPGLIDSAMAFSLANAESLFRRWSPPEDGRFHDYWASLVRVHLETSTPAQDSSFDSWTSRHVEWALDGGGYLGRVLGDLIVRTTRKVATGICGRRLGPHLSLSREDIHHDTIRKIYEFPGASVRGLSRDRRGHALRLWDPSRNRLPAYIGIVARHHIWAMLRRDRMRPGQPICETKWPELATSSGFYGRAMKCLHIEQTMTTMSARDRAIVREKILGTPSCQIAKKLEMSRANVDVRWYRFRKNLDH